MKHIPVILVGLASILSLQRSDALASATISGALNQVGEQAGTLSLIGADLLGINKITYFQTNFFRSHPELTFAINGTELDIQIPANLNIGSLPFPFYRERGNFWLFIESANQGILATSSGFQTISGFVSSGSGGSFRYVTPSGNFVNAGGGGNITYVASGGAATSGGGASNYYFIEDGATFTFGGGGGGNIVIHEPNANLIGTPTGFVVIERGDISFAHFTVVPEPASCLLICLTVGCFANGRQRHGSN